ncbi:MAG: polysaccharide pyruvyl transferase family protein [Armatimonadota bacterium]
MIVEVSGGEFVNRGALLMLRTVAEMLRRCDPPATVCVDVSLCPGYPGPESGIAPLFPRLIPLRRPYWMFSWSHGLDRVAGSLAPRALCEGRGFVRRRIVRALMDISGYAFGDPHPWQRARLFANMALDYRRRRCPVVMLPQMLGPFRSAKAADEFRRILDSVDLVFARDKDSLEMAQAVSPGNPHIRLAPDITIFSDDLWPVVPADGEPYVCIVPNVRMLDRGGAEWGEIYLPLLAAAARQIRGKGLLLYILLHDGSRAERELAERLVAKCGEDCRILDDPDPVSLKRIIAGARFVVGSRYHAIVAALSSGVPAVTMGWAHKYDRLLEDYGEARLLIPPRDAQHRLLDMVEALSQQEEREAMSRRLKERREAMREANHAMWDAIFALLQIQPPGEWQERKS